MSLPRPRRVALGAGVAALTALTVGELRQRRRIARRTRDLYRTAMSRDRTVSAADFAELPEPVRQYFEHVLPTDQPHIDSVRLEQTGRLRVGGLDSAWKPFTATQHVTTHPPGFFWDASVRMWPLVPVRVADFYHDGNGHAAVTLFGLLSLGRDTATPELNHGELLRYLAEAVWYPTALLPSAGVEWEAIDERTAAATLTHGETTATLTFHFTANNEVSKVHAEDRPRRVADGYESTPWTGRWRDYQTRNGVRVPTAGEVVWHLPEGDLSAWRGRLTEISYPLRAGSG